MEIYNKILAAVDGGFTAESAAKYAILIAEHCDAKLYLIFVITKNLDEKYVTLGRLSVERLVNYARSRGIEADGQIIQGPVVETIKSIVENHNIDLVISSTRHKDSKSRYFVRSISQKLMRSLSCSMIVIKVTHPGKTLHIQKILVPVMIGSYHAEERAYLISKLDSKARIRVLRVEKTSRTSALLTTHDEKLKLRSMGRELLQPLAKELSNYDIPADMYVDMAPNYAEAVLKNAAAGHFDLIIIGATNKDIIRQIVQGNPVEEILRKTSCDVIIWHPGSMYKI
ncbi:MAG TPA: universal stress protein [Candidatus Nanoarchaeia archaeon]|nr:universal stress protein [Candidatus Nanoarchaeia archaeon]